MRVLGPSIDHFAQQKTWIGDSKNYPMKAAPKTVADSALLRNIVEAYNSQCSAGVGPVVVWAQGGKGKTAVAKVLLEKSGLSSMI
jgi:hypothetical protein